MNEPVWKSVLSPKMLRWVKDALLNCWIVLLLPFNDNLCQGNNSTIQQFNNVAILNQRQINDFWPWLNYIQTNNNLEIILLNKTGGVILQRLKGRTLTRHFQKVLIIN